MNDTIDRQAAIQTAERMYKRCDTDSIEDYHDLMIEALTALSSAQQKTLKYSGDSICLYCMTRDCVGCIYEPMEGED